MITIRKSEDRGHANYGWLDTKYSFSFSGYYDPRHMHFRTLRVINEDKVAGGGGFPEHDHDNMEIITYVLSGSLEHGDSMGNGSVIERGDVQRMSAGSGITHSEFNHSPKTPVKLLQIWLFPETKDIEPSYEQKHFSDDDKRNQLREIVSGSPTDGAMKMHQDATMYASILESGQTVTHTLAPGRFGWLQLISGSLTLNDVVLQAGDAAAVSEESLLTITASDTAEFLLFDLA
ncbi:MAG: pirin family protein [bacterium]|nr:pirin family protein [bacterium]